MDRSVRNKAQPVAGRRTCTEWDGDQKTGGKAWNGDVSSIDDSAGSISVPVHLPKYDAELDALAAQIERARTRTNPDDKLVESMTALTMTKEYLAHFVPPGATLDVMYALSFEKMLYDWGTNGL